MERNKPDWKLENMPCSVCAVACALNGDLPDDTYTYMKKLHRDGYASLSLANSFIRNHLTVQRRRDFKQGERPKLKDLHCNGRAIVCVLGHYIYLKDEEYWSFFDNEEDDVVAVWQLKEEK